ncbi:MAG: AsmA family protein [Candidatus Omnitrophota bacterium]|nr:MAG: AsmA family protein [Candidatus Omnitrophota bacterium]
MRKVVIYIFIIFVVIISLFLIRNIAVKTAITKGVKVIAGLDLKVKRVNIGLIKTFVNIGDLKLLNPVGFVEPVMVSIGRIYLDYDPAAFFRKEVHINQMKLDLEEFVVVKNEKGEVNLDSLRVVKDKKRKVSQEKKEKPKFKIDVLDLKIDRVLYKDYSQGTPPRTRVFNVNINERFVNITDARAFARLIVVKALINTTISRLADFDLDSLKEDLFDVLGQGQDIITDIGGKISEVEKEIKDTVEEAVEAIKKVIPFPEGE